MQRDAKDKANATLILETQNSHVGFKICRSTVKSVAGCSYCTYINIRV